MSDSRPARLRVTALHDSLLAEKTRYEELVQDAGVSNLRIQEDFRKYLCLRCAGFLEKLIHIAVIDHLESSAGGPVLSFAKSFFTRSPNLTPEAFETLIKRLGEDYETSLKEFLDKTLRETLADLLEIRNKIAHGDDTSGAKLNPARYFDLCNEVRAWVDANLIRTAADEYDSSGYLIS